MIDTAALDAAVRRFPKLVDAFRLDTVQTSEGWNLDRIERYRLQIVCEYRLILKADTLCILDRPKMERTRQRRGLVAE